MKDPTKKNSTRRKSMGSQSQNSPISPPPKSMRAGTPGSKSTPPKKSDIFEMDLTGHDSRILSTNYHNAISSLREYINSSSREGTVSLKVILDNGEITYNINLSNIYILEFTVNGNNYQTASHNYDDSSTPFNLKNKLESFVSKKFLKEKGQSELLGVAAITTSEALRFSIIQEFIANKIANRRDIDINEQLCIERAPLFLEVERSEKELTTKNIIKNWEKLSKQKRTGYLPQSDNTEIKIRDYSEFLSIVNIENVNKSKSRASTPANDVRIYSRNESAQINLDVSPAIFDSPLEGFTSMSSHSKMSPDETITPSFGYRTPVLKFSPEDSKSSPDEDNDSTLGFSTPPKIINSRSLDTDVLNPIFSPVEPSKQILRPSKKISPRSLNLDDLKALNQPIFDTTSKSLDSINHGNIFKPFKGSPSGVKKI